ncbi:MAG: ABC transporter ATP-binding protein [Deltaproteobacteria bacterium]|nr:ABC transporter ATP-binding protein [Deltaproteobacteria bacterium]
MIELSHLSKNFGNFQAVKEVTLQIPRGEIFGFLGPNGAGKTTTIRMMAGLMKPTSGRVFLDGKDVLRQPEEAKSILGFIPDRPYLYEKLTGQEFLEFIADLRGLEAGNSQQKRIGELLNFFDLQGWRQELVESYSHGMRQRLVIAAALLHRPKVLIVDEPMVGLDPKGTRLVKGLFRDLAHKGVSIFMSTHTLELAEEVCQRIGIINEGKVIALGNMQELREKAKTTDARLESLFLKLTGGEEAGELLG